MIPTIYRVELVTPAARVSQHRRRAIYLASFTVVTAALVFGTNVLVPYAAPQSMTPSAKRSYLAAVTLGDLAPQTVVQNTTAPDAKSRQLFWTADISGVGTAVDLLRDTLAVDALFPGYGRQLWDNRRLWSEYFQLPFGPDSFLASYPALSEQGFRVAYSWSGCFRLYELYGADVLVFGSSEVYRSLVPSRLAVDLVPITGPNPKVLFCSTYGMPMETVRSSIAELRRTSARAPQLIVWGYSFWLSYARSQKLAEYRKEHEQELAEYRAHRTAWARTPTRFGRLVERLETHRLSQYFPTVSWEDVTPIRMGQLGARLRPQLVTVPVGEGMVVSDSARRLADSDLASYLAAKLQPYYAITAGASESDCSMDAVEPSIEATLADLRSLSPNVYVYLAPTTRVHQRTVPECFLPAVKTSLAKVAARQRVQLLSGEAGEFGLTERDFIYPTAQRGQYYFDINHANYAGGVRITDRLSAWIRGRTPGRPADKD